ncbi:hypothetical protein [Actinosynnema sp. NPDC020468]|uniref:hypothetical protein n=1 Tax=Actinosynnema sp. NPDC020468 TaxID=3154488 RepID=UPI0033C701B9
MSSTPIYDELAAILLADQPVSPEKPVVKPDETPQPAQPVARTGGRRRKPDTEA